MLNEAEYELLLQAVYHKENDHLRIGQKYMNKLYFINPIVHKQISESRYDPFYQDSLVDDFLKLMRGEMKMLSQEERKSIINEILEELKEKPNLSDDGYSMGKEKPKYVLSLDIDMNGGLEILVANELIGYISLSGRCEILNNIECVDNYQLWLENGKLIDDSFVDWIGGGVYGIIDNVLKRIYADGTTTNIYDFGSTIANDACSDENIIRMKSGKAILF